MGIFNFFKKQNKETKKNDNEIQKGEELFLEAITVFNNGDIYTAIDYFTQSLKINNKVSSVYLNRGAAYHKLELYLLAFYDYMKALEIERKSQLDTSSSNEEIISAIQENLESMRFIMSFYKKNGEKIREAYINDGYNHFCKRVTEVIIEDFLNTQDKILFVLSLNLIKLSTIKNEIYKNILLKFPLQTKAIIDSTDYNKLKENIDCYVDVFDIDDETSQGIIYLTSFLACLSDDLQTMNLVRAGIIEHMLFILVSEQKNNTIDNIDDLKQKYYIEGSAHFLNQNYTEAYEAFSQAVLHGELESNLFLAECYLRGYGCQKSLKRAYAHLLVACNLAPYNERFKKEKDQFHNQLLAENRIFTMHDGFEYADEILNKIKKTYEENLQKK